MTLSTLWHICDPATHVECAKQPSMEVTSKRPPSDTPLVIEFHPPRYAVEGDGPVYQVPTETLLNWPHVISSRVGTEKR